MAVLFFTELLYKTDVVVSKESDKKRPESEAVAKFNDTLRRMLSAPPKPHEVQASDQKTKAKAKQKARK